MAERDSLIKWLEQAKREMECHAAWWEEMPETWCKARARQARDMVNDLHLVIKEAKGPQVTSE